MKRIILMAMLCPQTLLMSADVVKGRVIDSDSNEPLGSAQVEVQLQEDSHRMLFSFHTDSLGVLSLDLGTMMCRASMTIKYFGYEELKVKDFMLLGNKDTLDLGDLRMKMSDELMKEVTVKGKARQFYMKGDTVVFNPEAFNMEDGDRVADLLKKLPGVRIENDIITFNGKPVHMKMNGHDMVDDFLTGQLPVEAVQNVKAYERKSEKAEVTGVNDGMEEQILDIIIKPAFLDKWYGQTKLGAYTSKNYRASANLHYLSEKNPLGIYGRASDCGSRTGSVYDSGEWDNDNAVPQRQQYGKVSYQHNWKPKFVQSSYEDKWWLSSSPQHLDTHQNSRNSSETFLTGQLNTFSNSHSYNYNHSWNAPLDFGGYVHFGPRTYLDFGITGDFRRSESTSKSESQTYNGTEFAEDPQQLVNASTSESLSTSDNASFRSNATLRHLFEKGDFYFNTTINYNHDKGHSDSHSEYDYRTLGTTEELRQSAANQSDLFQTIIDAKLNYQVIERKLELGVGYWIDYWHKADNSENFRNGIFDSANSYDRMKYYLVNEPRVEVNADLGKLWIRARVKMQNVVEHFDYQRGKLDTTVHRITWFPRPNLDFKLKTTKTTELSGGAWWEYHVADLLDGLDYTDDTNPLFITKGNPNLKPHSDLSTSLSYRMMFVKGQQMLTWNLGYSRTFDPVASVSAYNSLTGGYTYTNVNVDDRQNWSASLNYDRALGRLFRMRSSFGYGNTQNHGIKTMPALDGPMEQFLQTSSSLNGNLRVSYEDKGWEIAATGSGSYEDVSYSDPTLGGQNLWRYRAGMDGKYIMKHWTFNLKGELVGNAGYLSDMMNRNRFALNASATWKFLKNRGQLTLSAKDILNQMDQTSSYIGPTSRSESRTETFHRYLALTFTYNFDAKAKKAANK